MISAQARLRCDDRPTNLSAPRPSGARHATATARRKFVGAQTLPGAPDSAAVFSNALPRRDQRSAAPPRPAREAPPSRRLYQRTPTSSGRRRSTRSPAPDSAGRAAARLPGAIVVPGFACGRRCGRARRAPAHGEAAGADRPFGPHGRPLGVGRCAGTHLKRTSRRRRRGRARTRLRTPTRGSRCSAGSCAAAAAVARGALARCRVALGACGHAEADGPARAATPSPSAEPPPSTLLLGAACTTTRSRRRRVPLATVLGIARRSRSSTRPTTRRSASCGRRREPAWGTRRRLARRGSCRGAAADVHRPQLQSS